MDGWKVEEASSLFAVGESAGCRFYFEVVRRVDCLRRRGG
jgi:hypothetical protein